MSGRDVGTGGHYIREFPAETFGNNNNWYPLDGYKHTLCGTLHRFSVHDPDSDEMDWNNFIIPDPEFNHLFTDALEYETGDWSTCGAISTCIEAEITPDQAFYENPWFPKSTEESRLEGRDDLTLCAYGPWVRDEAHENKPEIHPSELYWWKETISEDSEVLWLMQLDDDSNRYDDKGNFDFGRPWLDSAPSDWRPWAAAPRKNSYMVAFEVNPNTERIVFDIDNKIEDDSIGLSIEFSQFVRTAELFASGDDSGRDRHTITYDGRVIAEVREHQRNDEDIGITFVGVCANEDETRLQGYLRIQTAVSKSNDGEEGFHVIYVKKTKTGILDPVPSSPIEISWAPRVSVSGNALRETMRWGAFDNRVQALGDIEFTFREELGAAEGDLVVSRVALLLDDQRYDLTFQPDGQGAGGTMIGVPLMGSDKLEFTMESGVVLKHGVGGLALAPVFVETPLHSQAAASAWPAMLVAAGGQFVSAPTPPRSPLRVREWQLETVPLYAALRGGRVSPEDESPWGEEINEVIEAGDPLRMANLFGSTQPFRVTWVFSADNLTTGEQVPVRVNEEASPTEARVDLLDSTVPNGGAHIWFPDHPADAVFQIRATAVMTDTVGGRTEVGHVLWSHVVPIEAREDIDVLLAAVADVTEVSPRLLLFASTIEDLPDPDVDLTIGHPILRRARMARLFAMSAAEDERATIGELGSLIRGARLIGNEEEIATFIRADANVDDNTDLSDAIFVLDHLFLGGTAPRCEDAADADDNGALEITDVVYLLSFLFLGGPSPEEPFLSCGPDLTIDELTCGAFPPCKEP